MHDSPLGPKKQKNINFLEKKNQKKNRETELLNVALVAIRFDQMVRTICGQY